MVAQDFDIPPGHNGNRFHLYHSNTFNTVTVGNN